MSMSIAVKQLMAIEALDIQLRDATVAARSQCQAQHKSVLEPNSEQCSEVRTTRGRRAQVHIRNLTKCKLQFQLSMSIQQGCKTTSTVKFYLSAMFRMAREVQCSSASRRGEKELSRVDNSER